MKNINMNLRKLRLFSAAVCLARFGTATGGGRIPAIAQGGSHWTMNNLLHGYAEGMPGCLTKRLNEQSARLDTMAQCSKKEIALAKYYTGCYYYGHGDDSATFPWFSRTAQFGQPDAQFNIGLSYEHGFLGQMENLKQAIDWYSKATAQGSSQAMLNLDAIYDEGKFVERNVEKAIGYTGVILTFCTQRV